MHFLPRQGCWFVVGYEEVHAALARPQSFSNRVDEWMTVDRVLLGADPPAHTAARRVLGQHFTSQALEAEGRFAEATAERLLRPMIEGAPCDVMREFAAPLVEEVAAHFIGFDDNMLAAVRALQTRVKDLGEWLGGIDALIEEAADRLPIYEQLLRGGEGRLGAEEARSLIRLLWVAGTTTTRRVVASSVLLLLRNPSVRLRVESDASLLPAFVEESIRLHPPEHTLSRRTTEEVELGDVKIPAGANVKLCVAAANRDPARFEEPSSLVLGRTPNPQLSFGGGVHRCLGASLARVETVAALGTLLRVAPRFRATEPLGAIRFAGFTNDAERLVIEC